MTSTSPPSLLATCHASVLDGTYDLSRLETLPATLLVQLLQTCIADKLAAQAQHAAAAAQHAAVAAELAAVLNRRYIVEPFRDQDRVGLEMYERVERVVAKWEPMPFAGDELQPERGYFGDSKDLVYCKSTRCFELLPDDRTYGRCGYQGGDYFDVYRVISSALLLYRVCCLFATQVEVAGTDRYKCVWSAPLKHRATGECVALSEHKGGVIVDAYLDGEGGEFHADLVELLNLLCDDKCPHPYDCCVAGAVA